MPHAQPLVYPESNRFRNHQVALEYPRSSINTPLGIGVLIVCIIVTLIPLVSVFMGPTTQSVIAGSILINPFKTHYMFIRFASGRQSQVSIMSISQTVSRWIASDVVDNTINVLYRAEIHRILVSL